jgi:hypothetical protein
VPVIRWWLQNLIWFIFLSVSFHVFNSNLSLSSMLSGLDGVLNSGIGQFPFSSVLEKDQDQHPRSLRALWRCMSVGDCDSRRMYFGFFISGSRQYFMVKWIDK